MPADVRLPPDEAGSRERKILVRAVALGGAGACRFCVSGVATDRAGCGKPRPLCRKFELPALPLGEVQAVAEHPYGFAIGSPPPATFKCANAFDTQSSALGKLLLRNPCFKAQAAQNRTERSPVDDEAHPALRRFGELLGAV